MLSLCVRNWDTLSLFVNRVSLLLVSVVGLYTIARIWRSQPADRSRRGIPRPVLVFTGAWLVVTFGIITYLMAGKCQGPLTILERTIYGASLAWALGGMTWIVILGRKHSLKAEAAQLHVADIQQVLNEVLTPDQDAVTGKRS